MQRVTITAVLLVYAALACITILYCDGTGDDGDSVNHFLYARYAPEHPALFFHHWAKPLFVLLACPFARFGFTGIKVFNALMTGTSLLLTYRIAQRMQLTTAILAPIMLLASPLYFALTFSGLTEPMFACMLCAAILTAMREQHRVSLVIVSFLPFVRSEGLLMMSVFACFHVLQQRWRMLPLLLIGTIVYSIAGFTVHHDLLWTFTRIPYAHLESPYGHGGLAHFVVDMVIIVGVPVYVLFWAGALAFVVAFIRRKLTMPHHFLVPVALTCFVAAHSVFWYLGIFDSMGLMRVLICVAPLIALTAAFGVSEALMAIGDRWPAVRSVVVPVLLLLVLVFPFTPNPAALDIRNDLMLKAGQHTALAFTEKVNALPERPRHIVALHPYLSLALEVDRFDTARWHDLLRPALTTFEPGDVILWDNGFALHEGGVTRAELDPRPDLEQLFADSVEQRHKQVVFVAYRKR